MLNTKSHSQLPETKPLDIFLNKVTKVSPQLKTGQEYCLGWSKLKILKKLIKEDHGIRNKYLKVLKKAFNRAGVIFI